MLCKLTVYTVICVVAAASFASAASPDASTAVAPPSVASPKEIHIDESLASLRSEVTEPKDAWDKVGALSGLMSGLAVALIGFYATHVYNR